MATFSRRRRRRRLQDRGGDFGAAQQHRLRGPQAPDTTPAASRRRRAPQRDPEPVPQGSPPAPPKVFYELSLVLLAVAVAVVGCAADQCELSVRPDSHREGRRTAAPAL